MAPFWSDFDPGPLCHTHPVPRDPEDGVLFEASPKIAGGLEVYPDRPTRFPMARVGVVTRDAPHPGAGFTKFVFEFGIRRSVLLLGPGLTGRRIGSDDGEFVRVTAVGSGAAEANFEVGRVQMRCVHVDGVFRESRKQRR